MGLIRKLIKGTVPVIKEVNKNIKTKYNSDGLRQRIHIAENDGELQSFGGLVVVSLGRCSLVPVASYE